MDKISFIATYNDSWRQKETKVKFNLTLVKDGTTTILYGQMDHPCFGKSSVSGCAILSPEDTYNEVTGIKTAFKNLLAGTLFSCKEEKQLYSYFRKLLYFLPAGSIQIERITNLESMKV